MSTSRHLLPCHHFCVCRECLEEIDPTMEEQRLVDPRLLKARKYLETWSTLSQDELMQVKKLNGAFAALDSEDKLMEEVIATVGAFMVEMRSVGEMWPWRG
ncbi:hypothetical protein PC129_g488 [Phytophthora cactorum]|uniref:Uncharacterized protein n=1 Tax=Phytophthora cactorum TaxID=29920 RepID=A0A329STV1_9STRA|nr:hypothetical protein Pcac1_g3792 [Phytophthora cactorum]KAG2847716.1 hypothetical protein PC112_g938 [Phytophthora cactorum]KAG2848143.1 hypothetical protein PC111_g495 [Phytophthora cactorum]KAG2868408.1 hypothetical protein PC113_g1051 [Phytophthora cactorum]KAG2933650.1 hypothetical protein PC114_g1300 [Phytophthora cactorum]